MTRGTGGTAGPRAAVLAGIAVLLVVLAMLAQVGVATAMLGGAGARPTAQANNTTVPHENPETVAEQSSEERFRQQLAQRVAERLRRSSVNLSEEQYIRASEYLSEEEQAEIREYVEAANQGEELDSSGGPVGEFAVTQQRIARLAQSYNQTYQAYQAARDGDNDTRTRVLARRGDAIASQLRDNRTQLVRLQRNASETLDQDLSQVVTAVNETVADITARQTEIRQREFVGTQLELTANESSTAIGRPVVLDGRLRTVTGSPVANRTISIGIGNQTLSTKTDATGGFEIVYEPAPTFNVSRNLTATYQPEPGTPYLSAESPIDVEVMQTTPRIVIETGATDVGFGQQVTVSGRVTVDDGGVGSVPLLVTVGNQRLGTVRTTANGTFQFTESLPADVPSGEQRMQVATRDGGLALTASRAVTSLNVQSTPTSLSIKVTPLDNGTDLVQIRGRLKTHDGVPIPNQTVRLLVDGDSVAQPRTSASGWYGTVVTIPGRSDSEKRYAAVYEWQNTNLHPANASVTGKEGFSFGLQKSIPQVVQPVVSQHPLLAMGGVLLLLANLGLWGMVFWLRFRSMVELDAGSEPEEFEGSEAVDAIETREPHPDHIAIARDELSKGNSEEAIISGYVGVRRWLGANAGDPMTHWEFYRDRRDNGLTSEQVATLRELTEAYERVAYAGEAMSVDDCEFLLQTTEETFDLKS